MDQLSCIRTFIEIAKTKSFTVAARRRGLSRSSATKHLASLEEMVGARLLRRNSQFVTLTEAGTLMLEGSLRLLEDLDGLAEQVQGQTTGVSGQIRIGVPPSFGTHHLTPAIAAFLAETSNVRIALTLDDGSSNLVREGLDISIRIGESLPNTDEVAKLLTLAPQLAVASPAYIAKSPPLETPADLVRHNCLLHTNKSPNDIWSFDGPDGRVNVNVNGTLRSNFGDPLLMAALHGQGITIHPTYMVQPHVITGQLQVVLPQYHPTSLRIHAVYPQRRFLPHRVRVFLDFLKQWLAQNSSRFQ